MRQWFDLIKYRLRMYLSTTKFLVPLILFLVVTYITYQEKPRVFITDAEVSSVLVGYIMMWITFTFMDNEESVAESILFCNLNHNKSRYYGSKLLSLLLIGILFSFIGTIYPFIVNAVNDFAMFPRGITGIDFICCFLLHLIMAILFSSVSYFFQPRMIRDKKLAIILLFVVAALIVSKKQLVEGNKVMAHALCVIPPMSDIIDCFHGKEDFTLSSMFVAYLYGGVYSIIALCIGNFLVNKRDF